jgi:hypothetical protein
VTFGPDEVESWLLSSPPLVGLGSWSVVGKKVTIFLGHLPFFVVRVGGIWWLLGKRRRDVVRLIGSWYDLLD